jgi:Short C-terminal domain
LTEIREAGLITASEGIKPRSCDGSERTHESADTMNKIFADVAAISAWFVPFLPILCFVVYFAIESRWEAYTRRKSYEELKTLYELRAKSIITQEEFDEKKEELLSA